MKELVVISGKGGTGKTSLTASFAVCVNKWDLNPEMTEEIEDEVRRAGAEAVGRVRYDRAVTLAQMQAQAVVETQASCAEDIRGIWERLGL